jgi:DNA-binding beta-propeller fold protein YncE
MRIGHFLLGVVPTLLAACAVERPLPVSSSNGATAPVQGDASRTERSLDIGPVVRAEIAPPPLVGGTLATGVVQGRELAVASDTDRDRVLIFDLAAGTLSTEIALATGDEPGRVVLDAKGVAHVALRRGGAVLSIDAATGTIKARHDVCAAPRGLAVAADTGLVHVACQDGTLASFATDVPGLTKHQLLGPDLRDVVVDGHLLYVSHFRSANVDVLSTSGVFQRTLIPAGVDAPKPAGADGTYVPSVAWRMISLPGGGAIISHQHALTASIDLDPHGGPTKASAYGLGGCAPGVVHSALTYVRGGASTLTLPPIGRAALPIDVAVSPSGDRLALVLAGNTGAAQVRVLDAQATDKLDANPCYGDSAPETAIAGWSGGVVAASFTPGDVLVVQGRLPAGIAYGGRVIVVPGRSVEDSGHQLFHMDPGVGLACASCHPEGGDDGRTWRFDHVGPRRTPALRGGISPTAPFHWSGDLHDFHSLVSDVFVGRMGGLQPGPGHVDALAGWVDSIPLVPATPPVDAAAVTRGHDLFTSPELACATCHSGPKLTNNQTVNVGTGEALQVPSLLGLSHRAPYMHDGCASTIAERFGGTCGGGESHGHVKQLGASQFADLLAYLKSL